MYNPIQMKRSMKFGNNYWETYSPKLGRKVRFFSDLEYDNWVHIESNPNIILFCEQPLKIWVNIDGKVKESIFDMWVLYKDNTEEFIEVKYHKEIIGTSLKCKRSQRQIAAQQQWCYENNYKYSVKTEHEIRKNLTYLNTLKCVISQVKSADIINNDDKEYILDLLKSNTLCIKNIVKITRFEASYIIQIVCNLIYDGSIEITNPNIELSFDTEVSYIGEKKDF
ncbi:Tn7 transposase TnsA N-terminal domain-containing protein [Intestinibacter sp.]